ncbi:MAG: hypothetical protein ABT940_10240, partial [Alphaproteobacteria bacterium]
AILPAPVSGHTSYRRADIFKVGFPISRILLVSTEFHDRLSSFPDLSVARMHGIQSEGLKSVS